MESLLARGTRDYEPTTAAFVLAFDHTGFLSDILPMQFRNETGELTGGSRLRRTPIHDDQHLEDDLLRVEI